MEIGGDVDMGVLLVSLCMSLVVWDFGSLFLRSESDHEAGGGRAHTDDRGIEF